MELALVSLGLRHNEKRTMGNKDRDKSKGLFLNVKPGVLDPVLRAMKSQ